jgi:hypothetical protein
MLHAVELVLVQFGSGQSGKSAYQCPEEGEATRAMALAFRCVAKITVVRARGSVARSGFASPASPAEQQDLTHSSACLDALAPAPSPSCPMPVNSLPQPRRTCSGTLAPRQVSTHL